MRPNQFNISGNEQLLSTSLDLVEERKEVAMVQLTHYQQKLRQGYDRGIKTRAFVPGDLVLRKVVGNTMNPEWGKLMPNWEGPYHITSMAGIGAYCLEDLDENDIPRPWNVNNLRRQWMGSKRGWTKQREDGWMNYHMYYGHTTPLLKDQLEKPFFR